MEMSFTVTESLFSQLSTKRQGEQSLPCLLFKAAILGRKSDPHEELSIALCMSGVGLATWDCSSLLLIVLVALLE